LIAHPAFYSNKNIERRGLNANWNHRREPVILPVGSNADTSEMQFRRKNFPHAG
jgi:hypothetical protein